MDGDVKRFYSNMGLMEMESSSDNVHVVVGIQDGCCFDVLDDAELALHEFFEIF